MSESFFTQRAIDSFVYIFVGFFDIFSNHKKYQKKWNLKKKKNDIKKFSLLKYFRTQSISVSENVSVT